MQQIYYLFSVLLRTKGKEQRTYDNAYVPQEVCEKILLARKRFVIKSISV